MAAPAPIPDELSKVRSRVLLIVFLTVFLDMIGFGIVLPLLPFYVKSMGGSAQTVGFLLTGFAAIQFFATPFLGRLSDTHGRRRIMLISLAGNAAAMVIFALATHWAMLSLLFFSRLLAGATAGNLSACQAAIADVTTREERARGMGMLGAGLGLGLVMGPVLGGTLAPFGGWAPPLVAGIMAVIDFVFALFLMPDTRRYRAQVQGSSPTSPAEAPRASMTFWDTLRDRRMASVLLLYFLTFLVMTNMQVAMALLVKNRLNWGEIEAARLFTMFGVITLVVQGGLIGRLSRMFGELNLIILGAVLSATGMFTISQAYSPTTMVGGLFLFGLGSAVTNPSLSSLASRYAPPDQQGAILGLAQSAGGAARAIGPTWGGFLFAQLAPGAPFISGGIAALGSLAVGMSLRNLAPAAPRATMATSPASDESSSP